MKASAVLGLLAAIAIVAGVAMFSPRVALIVTGVLLLAIAAANLEVGDKR